MRNRIKTTTVAAAILSAIFAVAACQPKDTPQVAKRKANAKLVSEIASHPKEDAAIARLSPVHFGTGSDVLYGSDGAMTDNIEWLNKNSRAVIVLEGHCDERGGDTYNMELGDRRARAVKTGLIKKGIEADRLIMVVSYGERMPIDARHTPKAWDMNRRVEFIVR